MHGINQILVLRIFLYYFSKKIVDEIIFLLNTNFGPYGTIDNIGLNNIIIYTPLVNLVVVCCEVLPL